MLRTLNVGIGMTLLVAPDHVTAVLEALTASGTLALALNRVSCRTVCRVVSCRVVSCAI
jgi:phosphoribosylaminoimidazole (AIR) synthetase